MHIAVYAFDGITMFHLSIPQMVFGTVSRLGLANWQVSLFTTTSESVTPPQEAAAPAEGAGPPPSTAPSRTTIRTSEGYILGGLGGPELASEADVVVVPAWFSDGRPAGEELCSLLKTAHARGSLRRRPVPGGDPLGRGRSHRRAPGGDALAGLRADGA